MSLLIKALIVALIIIVLTGGTYIAFTRMWKVSVADHPSTGNCFAAKCHATENTQAQMRVAVNQKELTDFLQPIPAKAGSTFEMDFFFTGMKGQLSHTSMDSFKDHFRDRVPYQGVGVEVVTPKGQGWELWAGSAAQPVWNPDPASEWNTVWDRAASGTGVPSTRWQAVPDLIGGYYLYFGDSPWGIPGLDSAAYDDGADRTFIIKSPVAAIPDETVLKGDLDKTTEAMGADATVFIPAVTPPGTYQIGVVGIGHDADGRKAFVSRTFSVEVLPAAAGLTKAPTKLEDPSSAIVPADQQPGFAPSASSQPTPTAGTATPAKTPQFNLPAATGAQIFRQYCASCHDDSLDGYLSALGKGTEGLAYVLEWGSRKGMAPIRQLRPADIEKLSAYLVDQVQTSSQVAGLPAMPHSADEGACVDCHDGRNMAPLTLRHASFSGGECATCHAIPEDSPVVGGIAPSFPHTSGLPAGIDCMICHGKGSGIYAPPPHENWGGLCMSCHNDPAAAAPVPASPSSTPAPTGTPKPTASPVPGSPTPSPTTPTPTPSVTPVSGPPQMAHPVVGYENCNVCHRSDPPRGWMPAPQDHDGRTNDTCLTCHKTQ